MMEYVGQIIAGGYLVVMAIIDRKHRMIPIAPGVVCLFVVLLAQFISGQSPMQWMPGVLVGALMYVISRVSRGSIGEGDAFVYLVTGLALGFVRNVELLIISLFLASFVAAFLLLVKRVGRKYTMPFIPFTAVAYGVVIVLG